MKLKDLKIRYIVQYHYTKRTVSGNVYRAAKIRSVKTGKTFTMCAERYAVESYLFKLKQNYLAIAPIETNSNVVKAMLKLLDAKKPMKDFERQLKALEKE